MHGVLYITFSFSRTKIAFMGLRKQHSSNSHLFKNARRRAGVLIYLQHLFRKCGDAPQPGRFKWLNYQKSATVMEPGSSLDK